ncbi:hypothetical protein [Panacagrimonas sp.]|uniref:hypothetical protein n=1 Tax=Panacagrimonas sp. TaxID=2480088 RepID=UPI003B525D03
MSDSRQKKSHNDVSRLLQQLKVDAFEFRSFDRGPQHDTGVPDFDSVATTPSAPEVPTPVPPAAAVPVIVPTKTMTATPVTRLPPAAPAGKVDPHVGEVFGRLLRQAPSRADRKTSLKLALPTRPKPGSAPRKPDPSTLRDVFERLSRAPGPRVSLIRSRD